MPRNTGLPISAGDLVVTTTGHVFRVAEIYMDGKMARLEFTSGHKGFNSSLVGLRLATMQQAAEHHVCAAPSPREAAELMYDGTMPERVRASLRRPA